MTKLVSWNCNMAFREKQERVLAYDPDLLIVQECECPDRTGDWSAFSDWRWIGENEHKGLGVFARNGRSLGSAPVEGAGGRFTLPVTTDESVDVLGVWAMNDEQNPANRYIGQVFSAVEEYRDFVDGGTVVAGDFNWNVVWDESPKHPLCGTFSETAKILEDCGLQSAYHASTGSAFGREADSTFFMHKQRGSGYHTDYVFAPTDPYGTQIDCSIGDYDEWIDASDHVPVFVEL